MPFEQINYSQAVTFEPPDLPWTQAVAAGGTAGPNTGLFAGYSYFTAGSFSAGTAAGVGDRFRLWNSGALKEPTVFTVAGLRPNGTSNWFTYFVPHPQGVPVSGDSAISVPALESPRWLGSIGHVTGMVRGYTCPGGPDTLSLQLLLPADHRTDAINPGRIVQVFRGGSCVWEGKLDEPQPSGTGWTVTAHGAGTYGTDFAATYTTWGADEPVVHAIGRGMRWTLTPGIGSPPGIWTAQVQDSGSQTVTAHLNLLITGGGLLWLVTRGSGSGLPAGPWNLTVFPFKSDANGTPLVKPDRILICNSPVPRTIAADINTLILRYQATADIPATATKPARAATFATTTVQNKGSADRHGPMEYYLDITSGGVMTAAAAQTVGTNILTRFVRASFAGPFTAGPGQVRNAGGAPVDTGCDEAGLVYQVMMNDAPYGGEVAAAPLTFMSGAYSYDEDSMTATITPYQSVRNDMASLIAALYPYKF